MNRPDYQTFMAKYKLNLIFIRLKKYIHISIYRYVSCKRFDFTSIPKKARQKKRLRDGWLRLDTSHKPPRCVNKHQRALWVENVLP